MTTTPTGTRRTRSPGKNQPDVDTEHIEQLAVAAAQAGDSLIDACPYPFDSEAGQHFCAVFYLHKNPAAVMHHGLTKHMHAR